MKVLALVSGGKDSTFSMLECVRYGHEIVALGNLLPVDVDVDELDSYMYQTVGHQAIQALVECMELPLYREKISGKPLQQSLDYEPREGDEVEDLFRLVQRVQEEIPDIEAVCSGAILSTYQRLRVENVCERLGLVSLSYLWERDQRQLFDEMVSSGISAVLVKVACLDLDPHRHLGRELGEMREHLFGLADKYGCNPCGEGGEYETLTLDCPLFQRRIELLETSIESGADNVGHLHISKLRTVPKEIAQRPIPVLTDTISVPRRQGSADAAFASSFTPTSTSTPLDAVESHATKQGFVYVSLRCGGSNVSTMFESLRNELRRHSVSLSSVAFVSLMVGDMDQFQAINSIYRKLFSSSPPSRCCIEPFLPVGCHAAMEVIAYVGPRSALHVQSISRWAPACIGPYSQATSIGNLVLLAGMIPLDPPTMLLSAPTDVVAQFELSLEHCRRVLKAKACSLSGILSLIVYVVGTEVMEVVRATASRLLSADTPVLFVPTRRLPRDSMVELQIVAAVNDELPIRMSTSTSASMCVVHSARTDTISTVQTSIAFDQTRPDIERLFAAIEGDWRRLVYLRVYCPAPLLEEFRERFAKATATLSLSATFLPVLSPLFASGTDQPQSIAMTALFSNTSSSFP